MQLRHRISVGSRPFACIHSCRCLYVPGGSAAARPRRAAGLERALEQRREGPISAPSVVQAVGSGMGWGSCMSLFERISGLTTCRLDQLLGGFDAHYNTMTSHVLRYCMPDHGETSCTMLARIQRKQHSTVVAEREGTSYNDVLKKKTWDQHTILCGGGRCA